jgi:MFS family permease
MNGEFVTALARELRAVGIRGRRHQRIVAEYEDHLRCEPNAQLGDPAQLAREFADELGTSNVRQGSVAGFAALALAAAASAVALIDAVTFHAFRSAEVWWGPVGMLGVATVALCAQVALAAGMLGILRSFWRRRERVVSRTDATLIVRRLAVALGCALATMVGLGLMAIGIHDHSGAVPGWRTLAGICAGVGALALIAAAPFLLRAARVRPTGKGERGDVLDELGPFVPAWLHGRPWRFAALFAAAIGIAVALAGVAAGDPYDGILRGVVEAFACLTGFAALGPFIGLWTVPAA